MKPLFLCVNWCIAVGLGLSASAQVTVTMSPLLSFGRNDNPAVADDGWLTPEETGNTYLGTIDSFTEGERSFAFSDLTDHLYLVSRRSGAPTVHVLDAATGKPTLNPDTTPKVLSLSSVSGGTFPLNTIAVAEDGAIYGANLTLTATTTNFKIYKWENETSDPVVVFDGATLSARQGDTLDAIGGGVSTRLVAGFGSTAVAGSNGYSIIDPNDLEMDGFTNVGFSSTPPNAGDFRLGITFTDADTVIGSQGGSLTAARLTDYSGAIGTFVGSLALSSASERPMDFAIINGIMVLATIETGGAATADTVRVYDMRNRTSPLLLATGNNTSGANNTNGNGVGAVKWGAINGDTATLYAMNTNNGIQAFTVIVTVPEPAAAAFLALGSFGLLLLRQRGSKVPDRRTGSSGK